MTGTSMLPTQLFVAMDPDHLAIIGLIKQYNEGDTRLPRDSERLKYTCLTNS